MHVCIYLFVICFTHSPLTHSHKNIIILAKSYVVSHAPGHPGGGSGLPGSDIFLRRDGQHVRPQVTHLVGLAIDGNGRKHGITADWGLLVLTTGLN